MELFTVQGQCGCITSTRQFNIHTLPLCGPVIMRGHVALGGEMLTSPGFDGRPHLVESLTLNETSEEDLVDM